MIYRSETSAETAGESAGTQPTGQEIEQLMLQLSNVPKGGKVISAPVQTKKDDLIQAFLRNHKKEISQMDKKLQQKLLKAISTPPRFHKRTYEKRARIDGIELYSCAADAEECSMLFLDEVSQKVLAIREQRAPRKASSNVEFTEWAELWFKEVFKPNVTFNTYENEFGRYEKHIKPYFRGKRLRQIAPLDCIKFFNRLKEQEIERTAEGCYGNMKRIFEFAVKSGLIRNNPMDSVKPIKHERKNGVPLTKEEERRFLARIKVMKYEAVFVVALYTGLRPCEYETAVIEGDFIIAQNRKQKNVKKIAYKKIPITPMLRPYLSLVEAAMPNWKELTANSGKKARWQFQELLPKHRMYDLRTTFATRSQECGVSETVVQVWMGHSPRTLLGRVYTKYSDDHLLSEGEKVRY